MSLLKIKKCIRKRNIDKIISLIPKIKKEDYNELDDILSKFLEKELDIANICFNIISLHTNNEKKKKTPEVGCFQLIYDK